MQELQLAVLPMFFCVETLGTLLLWMWVTDSWHGVCGKMNE
jgi:hypothetical protein